MSQEEGLTPLQAFKIHQYDLVFQQIEWLIRDYRRELTEVGMMAHLTGLCLWYDTQCNHLNDLKEQRDHGY